MYTILYIAWSFVNFFSGKNRRRKRTFRREGARDEFLDLSSTQI